MTNTSNSVSSLIGKKNEIFPNIFINSKPKRRKKQKTLTIDEESLSSQSELLSKKSRTSQELNVPSSSSLSENLSRLSCQNTENFFGTSKLNENQSKLKKLQKILSFQNNLNKSNMLKMEKKKAAKNSPKMYSNLNQFSEQVKAKKISQETTDSETSFHSKSHFSESDFSDLTKKENVSYSKKNVSRKANLTTRFKDTILYIKNKIFNKVSYFCV